MSETDVFERQGLGGSVGKGHRTALIVVDFVNCFVDPEILGGGSCLDAAEASVPVLSGFRDRSLPIVFKRIVYAEDGSDVGVWCEKPPASAN
jgi:maleamate amidohydrolase